MLLVSDRMLAQYCSLGGFPCFPEASSWSSVKNWSPPGRDNVWGYSPLNWFTPHHEYCCNQDPLQARDEIRTMVAACHDAQIEVIVDVVYNHTGESTDDRPNFCSFRGIDNANYYMMDENNNYMNYTGCGNTVNANNPMTKDFILASLRHWVQEYKVVLDSI